MTFTLDKISHQVEAMKSQQVEPVSAAQPISDMDMEVLVICVGHTALAPEECEERSQEAQRASNQKLRPVVPLEF